MGYPELAKEAIKFSKRFAVAAWVFGTGVLASLVLCILGIVLYDKHFPWETIIGGIGVFWFTLFLSGFAAADHKKKTAKNKRLHEEEMLRIKNEHELKLKELELGKGGE